MENADMMVALSYGFGFMTVWFFCIRFFNEPLYPIVDRQGEVLDPDYLLEPVSPRLMTNRYRYRFYLFLFIVITEGLYVLIAELLPLLLGQNDMGRTYNAFASALILTGFLPNLDFIRKYLDQVKDLLHKKAQIPEEGRGLYYHLKRGRVKFSRQVVAAILKDPEYGKGLEPEFFRSGTGKKTMAERWAWLAYIHYYINEWSSSPECRFLKGVGKSSWNNLRLAFFGLQEKLIQYNLRQLDRSASLETTKQLTALTLKTCIRLTGILLCRKSRSRSINDSLKELGYTDYLDEVFIPSRRRFAVLFLVLCISIIAGAALLWPVAYVLKTAGFSFEIPPFNEVPKWIFYGVPLHLVPIAIVLLAKQYFTTAGSIWPMVTRKNSYPGLMDRPWHVYVMVTGLSYAGSLAALSLLLVLNSKDYLLQNLLTAAPYKLMMPWALVGVVTAGFLAFRIDSVSRGRSARQTAGTFFGAVFQGAATTGTVWCAYLFSAGNTTPDELISYMVSGFITGTAIYSFSRFNSASHEKRMYRRYPTRALKLEVEADPEKGGAELVNISKRGALLRSNLRVSFGRVMQLRIGEGFQAQGEVVLNENGFIALHFKNSAFWNKCQGSLLPVPVDI